MCVCACVCLCYQLKRTSVTPITISRMELQRSLFLLVCGFTIKAVFSSLYDPHIVPKDGPFFEGWYVRITDFDKTDSLGLLFGNVVPEANKTSKDPLVLASILYRDCSTGSYNHEQLLRLKKVNDVDFKLDGAGMTKHFELSDIKYNKQCRLKSVDGKYKPSDLKVTVNGHVVDKNPDVKSPPNFKWQVNIPKGGGFLQQINGTTTFDFRIGELSLRGQASNPYPWSSEGTGPEGWLAYLPLPLHWFVFSLRSKLEFYELQNTTSGAVLRGHHGVVHLEKNWGESFPERWIWSEGVSTTTNSSFAISGGKVTLLGIPMDAYLIGYRNPSLGITLDFTPANSIVSADINGCGGHVNLTVSSLSHKVNIVLSAPVKTFSGCLMGPEAQGFRHACVESYDGTAVFQVFKKSMFFVMEELVDSHVLTGIGLEFGGTSVCNSTCSG